MDSCSWPAPSVHGVPEDRRVTDVPSTHAAHLADLQAGAYTAHRSDGWPLCPSCGEDELYSLDEPATIESIVGCYLCGWRRPDVARLVSLAREIYRQQTHA